MRRQAQARNPLRRWNAVRDGFRVRAFARPGMTMLNFVDRIFTTSVKAAFTSVFSVKTQTHAIACLCRARNAD
jgi:hypothetical protein